MRARLVRDVADGARGGVRVVAEVHGGGKRPAVALLGGPLLLDGAEVVRARGALGVGLVQAGLGDPLVGAAAGALLALGVRGLRAGRSLEEAELADGARHALLVPEQE